MIRLSVVLVCAALMVGCSCDSPTSPSVTPPPTPPPVVVPPATPTVPAAVCSTEAPQGLTVGQVQGRTDFTWRALANVTAYLLWIQKEGSNNGWEWVAGAPATVQGVRYEWYGFEVGKIHAVRVQSLCGQVRGTFSEPVVFGGREGPRVPPVPPPPPPPPPVCIEECGG